MSMNGKQRSRWLSDMISEMQRYVSKSDGLPESPLVKQALDALKDARQKALADASQ